MKRNGYSKRLSSSARTVIVSIRASTLVRLMSSHIRRLPALGLGFQFPPLYCNCTKATFEASHMAKVLQGKRLKPQITQIAQIKNQKFLWIINHGDTETQRLRYKAIVPINKYTVGIRSAVGLSPAIGRPQGVGATFILLKMSKYSC